MQVWVRARICRPMCMCVHAVGAPTDSVADDDPSDFGCGCRWPRVYHADPDVDADSSDFYIRTLGCGFLGFLYADFRMRISDVDF